MRRALASLILAAVSVAPQSPAAPLSVRAATSLEVGVERDDAGARLTIRLAEEDGPGLGLRPLEVEVSSDGAPPRRELLLTDASGRGVVPLRGRRARYRVRFAGGERHGPQETQGEVGLGQTPTRLLVTSDAVAFGLRAASVMVTAHLGVATPAMPGLADAPLRVTVDDGPVQTARTGPDGRLQLVLSPRLSPASTAPARPVEVRVAFEGTEDLAPAEATKRFPRELLTRLTLRAGHEDEGAGRLRFSGRASHELGGWAGAPVRVSVTAVGARARFDLPAVTDGDGIWNAAVPLEALHAAGARLIEVAAFVPGEEGYEPAESALLRLEVPSPAGRSAAPALLVGLGVLAGALAGRRAARWLRRRVAANAARRRERAAEANGERAVARARRGDLLRLRFEDVDSGAPAEVSARAWLEEAPGEARPVAEGERVAELEAASGGRRGRWRVEVGGPGLMPTRLELPSPHDGRGDGLTVGVERVARRVRRIYEAELGRAGVAANWGRKTPREAASEASQRSAEAPSPLITEALERAYFAPEGLSAAEVELLERATRGHTDAAGGDA